ncbi:MerR family transcriptional regulator [Youngiibacter multivorans]|uniref:DNA-binding transcriptional MerR regulator n=1 Tax=Youngiibacter multivorans TaxID=937251 RepID=A0ABS4G8C4_9CLOT|nr:MerR family transcriptional regulator [Youngiibacter multivorans]MBP1920813.1 DNA-binding transcriptional MerR regulator [Youngiibacter multivorans]
MYTMKETSHMVGMTYEALKFYCNEGLIPNVKRDKNNHRIFDDRDVSWIDGLTCLRKCGMSISDMKIYLNLCLAGESSILERKAMLDAQRKVLVDKIRELNDSIEYIDSKQEFYDDVLEGKTKYFSNLITV